MRAKNTSGHLSVHAIAGTHVVLLAMNMPEAQCKGLLGFAIHRTDPEEKEAYWLEGMKVFKSVKVDVPPGGKVSTRQHPVQGFTWSDFSAKPAHHYTYRIVALYGAPSAPTEGVAVDVDITTESAALAGGHEVYFNRGAAASQAYAERFQNQSPDTVGDAAWNWLSRGLAEALAGFVSRAGDHHHALRVAAYEFTEDRFMQALREAATRRKADVRIIYHARERVNTEVVQGKRKATQTGLNRAAVKRNKLSALCTERLAPSKSDISHNKFIVLLHKGAPVAVLTGSTNFSTGGIYGHSNVVHVVNNAAVAQTYLDCWNELVGDPAKATLKPAFDAMCKVPAAPVATSLPPTGTSTVFSPRTDADALTYYQQLALRARGGLFMTFAFGMNPLFQHVYATSTAPLRMALMERTVVARKDKKKQAADEAAILALRKMVENRFAVGGTKPHDVLEHWAEEKLTGLNPMVKYLHTKYMLVDPLGPDPIVVSGSANFSDASCTDNDENMLVIRGDERVADIYLGEFMRLYKHYAFRDWLNGALARGEIREGDPLPVEYLDESDTWWGRWFGKTGASSEREYFTP
ncbi:MAG: hypothetical protein HY275_02785 [Gemmatimonadetes bacterium]|nr:hypothetical protein [Gemmatimonadota bacterium]